VERFLNDRQDTVLNPALIIEVLSKSLEPFNRGQEFDDYRTLDSYRSTSSSRRTG
jgi:hypothetical protein